jgi:hypothetical protein
MSGMVSHETARETTPTDAELREFVDRYWGDADSTLHLYREYYLRMWHRQGERRAAA